MQFISWNVNGLRATWNHGLSTFLRKYDADIYAFQETKVNEPYLLAELGGYEAYWSFCDGRKGYSGTLILTKYTPVTVDRGIGNPYFDTEGRIITLEYKSFYFVNCYFPNSQRSGKRRDYRADWDEALQEYLTRLDRKKPVVVCGDFNVPIADEDIYSESNWQEWNAEGFSSEERDNLIALINSGFVDCYRQIHPDEKGKFSWWSNRLHKREENRGWRLDYFLASESLAGNIHESTMLTDVYGSDHCPIMLDIDLSAGEKAPVQENPRPVKYKYNDLIDMETRRIPFRNTKFTDLAGLWESIDWNAAEEHLQTMQMALAKSAYTHSPDLIEKWQKKIVFSIDAKLLAVRHVCSTAAGSGVDRIKWMTSEEKMTAALSLTSKGYRALPSRLLLIKSKQGKQRRVHVETYYDRAMQTLYAYALDPIAESWGDRKSFAYRKGRSQYDMNEYIISAFSGEGAPEWAFIADVRKCYENISHDWILKHIPMAENVLREFLGAGYVFAGELFPMDVGIGIGCSISPIIANMVLDGLQEYIFSRLYPNGDIDYANGNLLRYADDIIIAVRSEETANVIKRVIRDFLGERGLELSTEKSRVINIKDGFTFMSRTYEKRGDQLYARPSDSAVERFMTSMKETIEGYTGSQKSLIAKINKKIDGWVTYHKVSEASAAFRQMDVYISALLLQLCEQKHPKWTREKILEKYWYVDYEGRHCYALTDKKEVRVKFMSDSLFYPYNPVKTNLNPYIEFDYLESRTAERQILSVTGVYRSIWNRQNGKCYYCGRSILRDEEKTLVDVDESQPSRVKRKAYVHKRCMNSSFDYVDTESLPSSLDEVMDLLLQLEEERKPIGQKYYALSEFFRTCDKNSVTLTFSQIEEIMGVPLGATALRKEYWYRTGFMNISQCWLDNGYEIKNLHLDGRKRVVFHITSDNKNTSAVVIPEVLKYQRIPNEAKYELENYFQYILKKYGL
ncbi:MAG: exodeoxyribonuclease III [Clostridiales bacterium]|nr:exodeoxyribonuclease III [Clostridiales bacterium]